MAKKIKNTKQVSTSLQNVIDHILLVEEPTTSTDDKMPIKVKNTKGGKQLKLLATNTHDDLMDLLIASQTIAEKFYSKRTIKSGTALRKVYLKISKICLAERKVVLSIRGKNIENNQ